MKSNSDVPNPSAQDRGLAKLTISTREELLALGNAIGKAAKPGQIYLLQGPIGSGKTTLVKGFLQGKLGIDEDLISSPTFQYVNLYGKTPLICHFDLYRLESLESFLRLGFDEFFHSGSICLVEWPEVLDGWIEKRQHVSISIVPISIQKRQVFLPAGLALTEVGG